MKVSAPLLTCRCCTGTGKTRLSGPLLETFNAICKLGKPTIPEVYASLGNRDMDVTAANQRVRKLVNLGIVKKLKTKGKVSRYQVNGN